MYIQHRRRVHHCHRRTLLSREQYHHSFASCSSPIHIKPNHRTGISTRYTVPKESSLHHQYSLSSASIAAIDSTHPMTSIKNDDAEEEWDSIFNPPKPRIHKSSGSVATRASSGGDAASSVDAKHQQQQEQDALNINFSLSLDEDDEEKQDGGGYDASFDYLHTNASPNEEDVHSIQHPSSSPIGNSFLSNFFPSPMEHNNDANGIHHNMMQEDFTENQMMNMIMMNPSPIGMNNACSLETPRRRYVFCSVVKCLGALM